MNDWITRTLIGIFVLMVMNLSITPWCFAASSESKNASGDLAAIGEPSSQAVKFKVWTNKEEGEAFRPGDRAIIFLSADKEAHLTILSMSSDGRVTVVLPNKLMQDNMIQPNKLYALFGDDCPVRLNTAERSNGERLVIYLSNTPLALAPLKVPEGSNCLTIGPDSGKDMQILKQKLQTISKENGFNRTTLLLPGEAGDNMGIKLAEVSQQAKKKALPGGVESSVPETLTGSAGLKPLRKGNLKQ
jgi:hypothetical protein